MTEAHLRCLSTGLENVFFFYYISSTRRHILEDDALLHKYSCCRTSGVGVEGWRTCGLRLNGGKKSQPAIASDPAVCQLSPTLSYLCYFKHSSHLDHNSPRRISCFALNPTVSPNWVGFLYLHVYFCIVLNRTCH